MTPQDKIKYLSIVFGIINLVIFAYVGYMVAVAINFDESVSKYTNAPSCNNEIPTTPTICKFSNTTWLVCEEQPEDAHGFKTIINCVEVDKMDVRT